MEFEFSKGSLEVDSSYGRSMSETLSRRKVIGGGFFDSAGIFELINLGETRGLLAGTRMWAEELLGFTIGEHHVYASRTGVLQVYKGTGNASPAHTIPGKGIRLVDDFNTFQCIVGKSGWVFNYFSVSRNMELDADTEPETLENRFEQNLANAEQGIKPPFYDDTKFVKVEPGYTGKPVQVISFGGVDDLVVVDMEKRELIRRAVVDILSERRWVNATQGVK